MSKVINASNNGNAVREKILSTASELFYNQGIRAVGVDLVVEKAGVAKTSLYRYFNTKDDLVVAFLRLMDQDFWRDWDNVSKQHSEDAKAELFAQLDWMGERAGEPHYRGCPQINIAAEFPEINHPARLLAKDHKLELRRRLTVLAERLDCRNPEDVAGQLAILINGIFVSSSMLDGPEEAVRLLRAAASTLLASAMPS